jgi:uncharacterized protein YbjQ (UPF0145 family)
MNSKLFGSFVCLGVLATAWTVSARDIQNLLPIAAALESKEAAAKLDGSVAFRFGRDPSQAVIEILRSETARGMGHTSRGTMEKICTETFLSALTQLQKTAKQRGANAVINIVSAFKGHPELSSAMQYECYQGARTTSVMLRGDLAKIANK